MLDARELHALEPNVRAAAAMLSPETGIVDTHELMQSYRREAQQHGAEVCATAIEAPNLTTAAASAYARARAAVSSASCRRSGSSMPPA